MREQGETTAELAAQLGWDAATVTGVFSGSWRLDPTAVVSHDVDADPSGGGGRPLGALYVARSPPQLMLRLPE